MTMNVRKHAQWQPLLVALAAMALILLRMPDRVTGGFLWAEDGTIFLRDAYAMGIASFFKPYAQYLHLVPRVIVYLVSRVLYIDEVARPLAWICALTLCAISTFVFLFARKRFSLPVAWAFALVPVLIPHTGEVWLTITNLQWVLAPALLLLLWDAFCTPRVGSTTARSVRPAHAIAIVVLALTGPFGLIFSPLVAVRLVLTRKAPRPPRDWIAIAAYFAAVGIQFVMIMTHPPADPGPRAPLDAYLHYPLVAQALHYLALDFILPYSLTDTMPAWRIVAVVSGLLLGACLLLAERSHRTVAVGLFVLAAVLWFLGMARLGVQRQDIRWSVAGRYYYLPFLLMAWALLIVYASARRRQVKALAGLLLSMVLLNSLMHFPSDRWQHADLTFRQEDHTWRLQLPPTPAWSIPVPPAWKSRPSH